MNYWLQKRLRPATKPWLMVFLIVDKDEFIGVGAGLDLMHVLVELQTEKNRQVMQSIDYASTIQRAMAFRVHF